jgi:hypothetical protein
MNITKTLIALFSITLFSLTITAQSDIEWGNSRAYKGGSPDWIVGKLKSGYVLYGRDYIKRKPINVIYNFDNEMNFESSNIFQLKKYKDREITLEEIMMLDNEIVVFSSYFDKKEKKSFAYGQVLNTKGESKSDIVELGEVKAASKKRKGFFDFIISSNKKAFMVYEHPPFDKYNKEKFKYKVYDNKLKTLWEAEIELPFLDKEFGVSGYFLDANNNVYMIATIFEPLAKGEKRKDSENPYGKKVVLIYDHTTKKLTELDITMKSPQRPTDMAISVSDGSVKVVGFYADGKSYSAKGVFYYEISTESKKVVKSEFKEFSKEFVASFVGDKKANKNYGLINFDIVDIVNHSDQSLSFVAEYYHYYVVCTTDPKTGVQRCSHHYLYYDIIATRFDSKGKIEWITRVPKRQHTINDNGYFSSYAFGQKDNELFLVYNENPKNIPTLAANPQAPLKALKNVNMKKAIPMLVRINEKGVAIRTGLFGNAKDKFILRPKFSDFLRGDEMVLFARTRKEYKLGRLDLNN